jgi:hypothetical protein
MIDEAEESREKGKGERHTKPEPTRNACWRVVVEKTGNAME